MDNNIFDFGKSELTHDAIISWIINGFNYQKTAKEFYDFSIKFIKRLDNDFDFGLYNKVEVKNQFNIKINIDNEKIDRNTKNKNGKIDVLAIFSGDSNNKYFLVIEDKVFSGESGNQFEEYFMSINKEFNKQENKIMFVNIILGNFSKYYQNKVKDEQWEIITRNHIYEILNEENESKSHEYIVLNYYKDYLYKIDQEYSSFIKYKDNLNAWTDFSIYGFYTSTLENDCKSDFGFVPNKRGGFCGLWFEKKLITTKNNLKFNIYLQLEFYGILKDKSRVDEWKIAVKIEDLNLNKNEKLSLTKLNDLRKKIKNEFKEKYNLTDFHKGKTMTVCKKNIESKTLEDLKEEIDYSNRDFNSKLCNVLRVANEYELT